MGMPRRRATGRAALAPAHAGGVQRRARAPHLRPQARVAQGLVIEREQEGRVGRAPGEVCDSVVEGLRAGCA